MATIKKDPSGKRAKISKAQQYMIMAVLGTSLFLGLAIAVVMNSITRISFSAKIISNQDQAITNLSDTIKNIGICRKPSGKVYTDEELKRCNPDSVTTADVSGSLRSSILVDLASNSALESVPNTSNSTCINSKTGKHYTYSELEENYNAATSDEARVLASNLIKSCSALRVIPDALPAFKNEEALLASIDKIFRDSNTEPEGLTPSGESAIAAFGTNLYTLGIRLSIESDAGTLNRLLDNVERSIRTLNIEAANVSWSTRNTIEFQARGNAYYMTPSTLNVVDRNIRPGGK